jgi:hypothetical protein
VDLTLLLEKIIAPTDLSKRQTKIICTLGPACWNVKGPNQLEGAHWIWLERSPIQLLLTAITRPTRPASIACARLPPIQENTSVSRTKLLSVGVVVATHAKDFRDSSARCTTGPFAPRMYDVRIFDWHFGLVQLHDTNKRQFTGQLGLEYWIILQHYFYCAPHLSSTIQ